MTYDLEFKESALKEWQKLDGSIREQFKKKLKERLETPRVESCKLSGMPDCYKIKLKNVGYRLVFPTPSSPPVIRLVRGRSTGALGRPGAERPSLADPEASGNAP